jgi:topoisomerase IV subunit B
MTPRRFAAKNSKKSVKKSKAPASAGARTKAVKKPAGKQPDLFEAAPARAGKAASRAVEKPAKGGKRGEYGAHHIEVLEGLEPVRRRPGMYVGGTDERALHHLFAEVIDNAMDEAIGGHATFIEVDMEADGFISVMDNGRGIPVEPHPEVQKEIRTRSHYDDASRGRKVSPRGL